MAERLVLSQVAGVRLPYPVLRRVRLSVRTRGFHPRKTGSIPVRALASLVEFGRHAWFRPTCRKASEFESRGRHTWHTSPTAEAVGLSPIQSGFESLVCHTADYPNWQRERIQIPHSLSSSLRSATNSSPVDRVLALRRLDGKFDSFRGDFKRRWSSGLGCRPVTAEDTGPNPVRRAYALAGGPGRETSNLAG